MRWQIIFQTANSDDYVHQLADMGAIVAVPEPDTRWRVFNDLKQRPPKGEHQDIGLIHKIFWVDENPASVARLARGVGAKEPPPMIVAFFPEALTEELSQKEHKYRGLPENEILETDFKVVRRGGHWEAIVTKQKAKADKKGDTAPKGK